MNDIDQRDPKAALEAKLLQFQNTLIEAMLAASFGVVEGTVMTQGPAPYRRLDYRGRALAYLKARPSKRALRVDVSGLWRRPRPSRLEVPTASGVTLMVSTRDDLAEAVDYLSAIVAMEGMAA